LIIGIANICSSVQDHRPSVISYKGSVRTNKEHRKQIYWSLKRSWRLALLKSMTSSKAEGPQKLALQKLHQK